MAIGSVKYGTKSYLHPTTHSPSIIEQDSSNRFVTDVERTKLNGIATGANNYTHPATHSPGIIVQDANNRFVTDSEKTLWNGKADASGVEIIENMLHTKEFRTLKTGTIEDGHSMITNGTSVIGTEWTTIFSVDGRGLLEETTNYFRSPLSNASKSVLAYRIIVDDVQIFEDWGCTEYGNSEYGTRGMIAKQNLQYRLGYPGFLYKITNEITVMECPHLSTDNKAFTAIMVVPRPIFFKKGFKVEMKYVLISGDYYYTNTVNALACFTLF